MSRPTDAHAASGRGCSNFGRIDLCNGEAVYGNGDGCGLDWTGLRGGIRGGAGVVRGCGVGLVGIGDGGGLGLDGRGGSLVVVVAASVSLGEVLLVLIFANF